MVCFYPIVATLTYDITYAIAYDIVGQTYDIVCDGVGNLRHRRPRRCLSYPTILLPIVPYDLVYDIVVFVRHRLRYLRVMSVLYAGVGYYTTRSA